MKSTIELKPFQNQDQPAAKALILDGLVEHWGFLDESKNPDLDDIAASYAAGIFLVAWRDDEIIGTGAFNPHSEKQVEIVRMSVAKKMRRQGVGQQVLSELCRIASEKGYAEVILETTETWQDVIDFYLNYGFDITHHVDGDVYFKMDLKKRIVRVIEAYQAPYLDPIHVEQGEIVTLDLEKETSIAGWVWCTDARGKGGWVPKGYLKKQDETTAKMLSAYNAIELTIQVGELLTVYKEESDFYWVRNEDRQEGWVPIVHVELYKK